MPGPWSEVQVTAARQKGSACLGAWQSASFQNSLEGECPGGIRYNWMVTAHCYLLGSSRRHRGLSRLMLAGWGFLATHRSSLKH